jgi:hypothetical protein
MQALGTKHGITPNAGYAGPVTWGAMDLKKGDDVYMYGREPGT